MGPLPEPVDNQTRNEPRLLQFDGPDGSWRAEWEEFLAAIRERREPTGNGHDGYEANRMIEAVYRSAAEGQVTTI